MMSALLLVPLWNDILGTSTEIPYSDDIWGMPVIGCASRADSGISRISVQVILTSDAIFMEKPLIELQRVGCFLVG